MHFDITDKLKLAKATSRCLASTLWPSQKASPAAIVWLLTYKCNAACGHCDFWQRDPSIRVGDIMRIAEKIARSDAFVVNLSGGEIFLVPNIRDVITLLKRSGKYIRINSNALIIEDYLDYLLEAQVDSISISMDYVEARQHDANRGKGAFERCLAAVDHLRSKRTGGKPEISIRCVLMKNNIDQLEDFIRFFSPKVDSICFQPIHDQKETHKVVDPKVLFDAADEPHVREVIAKIASQYRFLNNAYFRSFPDFIFHPEKLSGCAVDFCLPVLCNTLVIHPDGEGYVCDQPIGNVLKGTIAEVWNSSQRKMFLQKLAVKGKCPAPCWLNNSSARTALAGGVTKFLLKMAR